MSIVTPAPPNFFKDLSAVMRTKEFQTFYYRHMSTFDDTKTSLLYVELYRAIDNIYKRYTGNLISDDAMELLLRETIRRKEYRKPLVKLIQTYTEKGISRERLESTLNALFESNKHNVLTHTSLISKRPSS